MKKKILSTLLFVLSVCYGDESVCNTTSNKLMKILIENHPSIKMSNEALNASKEKVDSAFWGFFPTPSVEVSARDNDRYTTVARLEQPIYTGGKLTSAYDIAESSQEEELFTMQETSYNLIENYLSVLEGYIQAKKTLEELNRGLDNHIELMNMLDRRMEAGVSSSSDKDLLNARISQIQNDIEAAKNSYKIATMQLELMLDIKLDCSIELEKVTILHSANIGDSEKRLISTHPSIKIIEKQIQTAKYEVDNTFSQAMPTLALRAEHRRGDLYSKEYDEDSSNQSLVYATLSANTQAGLSILNDVSAAKFKVKELKYKKLSMEKELLSTLYQDYNNYEVTKKQIDIVESSVSSSQSVLDSYTRLFVAGKKQWLNLVDSSREVMQYRVQLVNLYVSRDILAYKLALENGQINLINGEFK